MNTQTVYEIHTDEKVGGETWRTYRSVVAERASRDGYRVTAYTTEIDK